VDLTSAEARATAFAEVEKLSQDLDLGVLGESELRRH
jgi:hypothetical protein